MKSTFFIIFTTMLLMSSCLSNHSAAYFEQSINDSWQMVASKDLKVGGKIISANDFDTNNWINLQLPSTVLAAMVKAGIYNNIYFSNNLDSIDTAQFEGSWWYRKEFKIEDFSKDEFYTLFFEGINYRANIWLNGELIANSDTIEGPYRMFKINISKHAQSTNVLAIEVFPPMRGDLTIGFVDWNPNTPDNNMGLWRGVKLMRSHAVEIRNVVVNSKIDLENYSWANLQFDIELENKSNQQFEGVVKANIEEDIHFELNIALGPKEVKRIKLNAQSMPQLRIEQPRLWWPVNMGKPELYNFDISVYNQRNNLSHQKHDRFGIRQVSDTTFMHNNELVRGYIINGKRILLRGGGWVDDMTLSDSDEKVRAQVAYVKHMNLNTIRLEGFWGNSKALYDACDENGVLLMIGLSCQWEWEAYSGRPETDFMSVETDHDIALIAQSFQDQVKWGMNHPSIFLWVYGSDKLPSPKFETHLNNYIRKYDNDRCILASCKSRWQENDALQTSSISGSPGSKMLGPYDYVPPVYWYDNNRLGSAYGFNTETGPGAQVPPIESLRKMLPADDVDKINEKAWQYHSGRNQFQTLDNFLTAYNQRYWKSETADEFAFNVQMSNYEAMRAMFEAFEINRNSVATGLVQWMLNSAWPNTMWQLYDWYLNPNGAFYGAKTACQPLSVIYNYANQKLFWSNSTANEQKLNVTLKIFDNSSKLIFQKNELILFNAFDVQEWLDVKQLNIDEFHFLSLQLKDENENLVAENFYWLSASPDLLDYSKSTWYNTPQRGYANFSQLQTLNKTKVKYSVKTSKNGNDHKTEITLTNLSDRISFFNEMRMVDSTTNENILPVFWSDNYVSLLPNETKTFTVNYKTDAKTKPLFVVRGLNSVFSH